MWWEGWSGMQQLGDMTFDHYSGSTPPSQRGWGTGWGWLDFWTQRNPGENEIFHNQGGKKKKGERGIFEIFIGGKLLQMKLQTENKISEWI